MRVVQALARRDRAGYPRTEEGRLAPLRRLRIQEQANSGATLERPIFVTPTFVQIEAGHEIGRLVGYPGSDFFCGLLGGLLRRLPARPDNDRQRPDAGVRQPCGCGMNHLMLQTISLRGYPEVS